MRKPSTKILVGAAAAASIGHTSWAPFPGPGGNTVLDLIVYHDPGFPKKFPIPNRLPSGEAYTRTEARDGV